MKLLVFAHTPPPHHGQSYMVQLMMEGLGGDARLRRGTEPVQYYHVNCRFSSGMQDIGKVRFRKALLLLRYCLEAIWCRFRYGVSTFYYVPAPGKRGALYRDLFILALCRPFFKQTVFHWHALGLTDWLSCSGTPLERWISARVLARPTLSIALAESSAKDAQALASRKIKIIPNGIPDPCPDFKARLLAIRERRLTLRREQIRDGGAPIVFRVLFMAHGMPEKGLFDTLEGVAILNKRNGAVHAHLTVAGAFPSPIDQQRFCERIAAPDLAGSVTYAGFVSGKAKQDLLEECDCFCFPTYYDAESFGLVIVEAMAFGLPSVTTRWRAIPEILPPDYTGYVDPKAPDQIADALERMAVEDHAASLRARYLERFSAESYTRRLSELFASITP